jgi:hypothetical protein
VRKAVAMFRRLNAPPGRGREHDLFSRRERAPDAPAPKAFFEIAGRVAAEISKQNARVLKVIQTA